MEEQPDLYNFLYQNYRYNGKFTLENLAEVLAKIETDIEPPDLLILDVMMPEINGYEVAQRIRQSDKFKSLPILLVTGLSEDDGINESGIEVNAIIQKPYDPDGITAQVLALIS